MYAIAKVVDGKTQYATPEGEWGDRGQAAKFEVADEAEQEAVAVGSWVVFIPEVAP